MILLLAGCTFDEFREPLPKVESKTFSIEQAKAFFENDYTGKITKSSSVKKNGKLHPGDFTPLWDKAVYSEKGGKAAYDVSIMTDRRIAATRLTADGAQRVRVYQKLVVTQSTSSGKMTAYIMSLIPDDDQGHFPKSFSSRKSYRGNYSGIVVYTTVDNGALVRVQEYKDGKLHRGANLTSGKDSYLDQCRKAVEILRGIKLSSKRLILTKAGENWDDWDDWGDTDDGKSDEPWDDICDDRDYSGWDLEDFEDLGYGIYTDGEGNYYIDIDGDGDLDLETIAPGGITEDNEEDDPWPPTPPEEPEPDDEPDDVIPEPDDEPNNIIINSSQVSIQDLRNAQRRGVEQVKQSFGDINAYCNQGVRFAFNNTFSDLHLPNICANDLVRYWLQNTSNWSQITMQEAIQYASKGYFVVAGWINNGSGSGHVAVVVPAETIKGRWNGEETDLPLMMDTGYKRRSESIGINYCFGKDKHQDVIFFKFTR